MRFNFLILLYCLVLSTPVLATKGEPAQIPEPPGLPHNYTPSQESDPDALEPEVTIVPKQNAIHEEYRINGVLYMIKVKPKKGPAYYLIDREGAGDFTRSDFEPKIAIPKWVIKRF